MRAVEHYDREYGELLQNNLENEIGPEIAAAVCNGAVEVFTPQFETILVTGA